MPATSAIGASSAAPASDAYRPEDADIGPSYHRGARTHAAQIRALACARRKARRSTQSSPTIVRFAGIDPADVLANQRASPYARCRDDDARGWSRTTRTSDRRAEALALRRRCPVRPVAAA